MWPFKPRMVELPNGKLVTIKAFREQERIENKRRAELAELAIAAKRREDRKGEDAYTEDKTKREKNTKAENRAKVLGKIASGLRKLWSQLVDDLPQLIALIVYGVCFTVTVFGQIMFYDALPWPDGFRWLGKIMWVVAEGGSTYYAFAARKLAAKQLPYAAATRKMWLFAAAAALMNGYHGWKKLKEIGTGIVLGAASLIGPLIWHSHLSLTNVTHSKRSAAEIRASLAQRLRYPLLSWHTSNLWAAAGGAMSREVAWRITWMRAKGAAPGVAPTAALAPARNRWLFRLLFGRVVNPAIVLTASLPKRADAPPVSAPEKTSVSAEDGAPYSGGDGPSSVPVSAMIGAGANAVPSADESNWDVLFQRWEDEFAQHSKSTAERGENDALSSGRFPSSTPDSGVSSAQGPSGAENTAGSAPEKAAGSAPRKRSTGIRKPSGKRGRQRSRSGAVDYQAAVERYFRQRVAEGADPASITGPEVARETGAAESTARNILSALKRKHGQPGVES